ncbi:hypothetical protein EYS14_13495 [Alteromonadaceae bacterium M269]|nr:hypothetical protein EYS14_13495 [Alteromonadaceae bacterium M269]
MEQHEQKSPEQQRYIRLCAQTKKMYQAQEELENVQAGMAHGNDPASMMQLGYQLHKAHQTMREVTNSLYVEKKELEEKHPEFRAEALSFGKSQQQKREQSQQQGY